MATPIESRSKHEEFLEPLDNIITLVYSQMIQPKIREMLELYKETIFSAPTAVKEMVDVEKNGIAFCLKLIAAPYKKELAYFYTYDALIFYIRSSLRQLINIEVGERFATNE